MQGRELEQRNGEFGAGGGNYGFKEVMKEVRETNLMTKVRLVTKGKVQSAKAISSGASIVK